MVIVLVPEARLIEARGLSIAANPRCTRLEGVPQVEIKAIFARRKIIVRERELVRWGTRRLRCVVACRAGSRTHKHNQKNHKRFHHERDLSTSRAASHRSYHAGTCGALATLH